MTDYQDNWYQTIYFRSSRAEITHYKRLHAEIDNILGDLNRTDVNVEIFKMGIECLYQQLKEKTDMDVILKAKEELKELDEEESRLKIYYDLYCRTDKKYMIKFLESNGEDSEEIFFKFEKMEHSIRWPEKALNFLQDFLADGEPMGTKRIKEAALQEGVITETDKDWNRLRRMASVNGFTNHDYGKGFWALPVIM